MPRHRVLTDEERINHRRKSKREYMRRYRASLTEAERQKVRESDRQHGRNSYQRQTPEHRKQKRWAYKARLKNAPTGYVNIKKLKEEWNNLCGICKIFVVGPPDLDHIMPLSKGGAHAQENLQLTHPFCNRSKGNRI